MMEKLEKIWHLYVIRTEDGFLYTGITTDVSRRFQEHMQQGKKAARYLRAHKPCDLVFSKPLGDRVLALKLEYRFKRLKKAVKERVVKSGDLDFDTET